MLPRDIELVTIRVVKLVRNLVINRAIIIKDIVVVINVLSVDPICVADEAG